MSTDTAHGLINLPSKHSVDETLQKLESLLQEKNIMIFARVAGIAHLARMIHSRWFVGFRAVTRLALLRAGVRESARHLRILRHCFC